MGSSRPQKEFEKVELPPASAANAAAYIIRPRLEGNFPERLCAALKTMVGDLLIICTYGPMGEEKPGHSGQGGVAGRQQHHQEMRE